MIKELEGFDQVAVCLNEAESVQLIMGDSKYFGEIEKWQLGKAIVFKVSNLDKEIVKVPEGYSGLTIRAIGRDKITRNFPTSLLVRKLPRLLLQFPEKENKRIERTHVRVHVNITTPILLEKRTHDILPEDRTGIGTIENVSEGGASLTTQMYLRSGDTINFFLPVKQDGNDSELDLHGMVRGVEKTTNGQIRIGAQFIRLDRETELSIKGYMERRIEAIQNKF